jgi:two-component system, cell cycle response regulator DivK
MTSRLPSGPREQRLSSSHERAAADATEGSPPALANDGPQRSVLIVDDYADTRDLYSEYLTALGYRCDVAADGDEAVAKARATRPAVIVTDLTMPVLDGWGAIRLLREDPATATTPILVVTGQERDDDCELRARELGVDALFMKPFLPRDLANTIASVMPGASGRSQDENGSPARTRRGKPTGRRGEWRRGSQRTVAVGDAKGRSAAVKSRRTSRRNAKR